MLEEGDLIIDGGNTFFIHTERRAKDDGGARACFISAPGVSGGEEGARKGPGDHAGRSGEQLGRADQADLRGDRAPRSETNQEPCVTHIGKGGAGHFVKMVHNGIEYGDMQLICEAYQLFKTAGISTPEMAEIFEQWNQGELESYLIQITSKIFSITDEETGEPLVERIMDKAGQKGTGRWTVMNAAENAVVISTINAAVEARILSALKDQRVPASSQFEGPTPNIDLPKDELVQKVHDALYASKIISYAQGLDLIKRVGEAHDWDLDLGGIARIWRGGCIIRARFLNRITEAYERDAGLTNLMLDPFFKDILNGNQAAWREVVGLGVRQRHPRAGFLGVAGLLRQLSQ